MKNYTTKPIELPLSTEKEYVLVDESLTNDDFFYLDISVIKKPFKPTEIDISGDMWLNNSCVACVDGETNISSFHEVIRQPEIEVEWKDGDECLYDGSKYAFVGMTPTFNDVSCIIFDPKNGIERVSVNKLRKPETEAERKDRERKNAIYDMRAAVDNFTDDSLFWAEKFYDAGYRKEQN